VKSLLTCEIIDEDIIIKNRFYDILLSHKHGGTIRRFEFNNLDLGVIREGCEYWEPDNPNHYEQEYSPTVNMEIIDREKNFVMLRVNSRLVSPQLKTDGGNCVVKWLFRENNPIIYTDYQVFPSCPYGKADRYICFEPETYSNYSIMMDDLVSNRIGINGVHTEDKWWYKTGPNSKWGTVENNSVGLLLKGDPHLTCLTVFKSPSMIELKIDESPSLQFIRESVHSFYLPYKREDVVPPDAALFRETRLKSLIVELCKNMKVKGDTNADWFKRTLQEHNRGTWFLNNANQYTPRNARVLDIAGGIGSWGAYIIYVNGVDINYTNIDINSLRIETSKELFKKLGIKGKFVVGDWRKIDVEKYDVIFCFGAMYDFDDEIFDMVNKLLKNGGIFIFEIVEKSSNNEGYKYTLDIPEIKEKMESANFTILNLDYCAKYSNFNDIMVIGEKTS